MSSKSGTLDQSSGTHNLLFKSHLPTSLENIEDFLAYCAKTCAEVCFELPATHLNMNLEDRIWISETVILPIQ